MQDLCVSGRQGTQCKDPDITLIKSFLVPWTPCLTLASFAVDGHLCFVLEWSGEECTWSLKRNNLKKNYGEKKRNLSLPSIKFIPLVGLKKMYYPHGHWLSFVTKRRLFSWWRRCCLNVWCGEFAFSTAQSQWREETLRWHRSERRSWKENPQKNRRQIQEVL